MSTPEQDIAAEKAAARKWLAENKHLLPPVITDEIGSLVPLNTTGRDTPVVPLTSAVIGPVNNPHPTEKGRETLQPWPGQGSAAETAVSLRPTEDAADAKSAKKKR